MQYVLTTAAISHILATMWPFRRRDPDPTLHDVLLLLEQHRERTDRRLKEIELEWSDMFDRFRRLYAKISKRAKEAESATIEDREGTEGGTVDDRGGNGQPGPVMGVLAHRSRLRGW